MTSVRCPECQRTIGSPTGLASHMRSMHPDEHARQVAEARARTGLSSVPPPDPARPNTTELIWEEPPATRAGPQARFDTLTAALPELKRNAGKWARLFNYDRPTSASQGCTALRKQFPDLEIIGRKLNETSSAIYARYPNP